MTPERLSALRTLAAAATPGPWEADLDAETEAYDPKICANGHVVADLGDEAEWDDARFIAAARAAVPELCDEVERLLAQVELLLGEREAAFERGVHLAAGAISVLSGFDGETVARVRSRIYELAGRRPPEKR